MLNRFPLFAAAGDAVEYLVEHLEKFASQYAYKSGPEFDQAIRKVEIQKIIADLKAVMIYEQFESVCDRLHNLGIHLKKQSYTQVAYASCMAE